MIPAVNLERIPLSGERTTAPTVSTARVVIPAMMRGVFLVIFVGVKLLEESCVLLEVEVFIEELEFFIGFIGGSFRKKHTIHLSGMYTNFGEFDVSILDDVYWNTRKMHVDESPKRVYTVLGRVFF